jgi:hypothetical protein
VTPTSTFTASPPASTTALNIEPVILRWNGTTWKRMASPNPTGNDDYLSAVAATSARTAWAAAPREPTARIRRP